MSYMVFFEKPGCINGEKPKNRLRDAGHSLRCVDLLKHPWTEEELLTFVKSKKTSEMMNYNAPAIKNGNITPENLSFEVALQMMLDEPILIKRPLIKVDGITIQGFTDPKLKPYLGN